MIKLTGINKIYRTNEIETVALENVNLEVNKGEFLSIMGPSGCGKSTLLNIMGLLDAPTSGTIEIAGTKVDGMKDKELAAFRNRKLGFVFQSFHLINSLNVLDNVELPLLYRKVSAKERRHLAEEVLKKVGLSHRMRHMPTQLSGGQCQSLGEVHAHQQCPDQSGVCGHGNAVQFRQCHTGIVQCFLYHRQHVFTVPAGGDLRHNAAVLFVFFYL